MNYNTIKLVVLVVIMTFALAVSSERAVFASDDSSTDSSLSLYGRSSSDSEDNQGSDSNAESSFSKQAETDSLAERIEQAALKMLDALKRMMTKEEFEKAEQVFGDFQKKVDDVTPTEAKQDNKH